MTIQLKDYLKNSAYTYNSYIPKKYYAKKRHKR